jgi:hypothetical protein
LCREEGQALLNLAAKNDSPLNGFNLFGIIKETGVDDEGLLEFHSQHYPKPLYRDEDLVFYKEFLGDRKFGLRTFNPLRLYRGYKNMKGRLTEKGLEGNMIGEGLKLGGVVLFGKDGTPKYAYQEVSGMEMPVDDIAAAANAIKEDQ